MATENIAHGKHARIYYKTSGVTYTLLAGANEWTINNIREFAEGRVFESPAVIRRAGLQDSNISFGGIVSSRNNFALGTNAQQLPRLMIGSLSGTTVKEPAGEFFARFYMDDRPTATTPLMQGSVVFSDMAITAATDGLVTYSATAQAAGALHIANDNKVHG